MPSHASAIFVVFLLSAAGVAGDYFLKLANDSDSPFTSRHFVLGTLIYASMAFGWVIVFRTLKFAHVGVYYSISTVLLLCLVGFFFFNETLKPMEIVGVCLALISLLLLARVA